MSQFDLAEHLMQLANHLMRVGTLPQPLDPGRLESAMDILLEASRYHDAGKRATGMSLGLKLLSKAFLQPDLLSPENGNPVDSRPVTPMSEDLPSLQIACPTCGKPELVALQHGTPLPVLCRACGHQGHLT
jgi:hypothetical protein